MIGQLKIMSQLISSRNQQNELRNDSSERFSRSNLVVMSFFLVSVGYNLQTSNKIISNPNLI